MSIVTRHVGKSIGQPPTRILSDISVDIREGEFVSLTGRSGSGKSTLLYLLSSLDLATSGEVEIDGRDVRRFTPEELNRFRNENVGFVFQFHYLIAELSALENVLMPARRMRREREKRERAEALLEEFGLGAKFDRLPRQLSGGEQQRVAIARALLLDPKYIFADEPTGALDTTNGELVMNILRRTNEKIGTTIVLVTHDPGFSKSAKRRIQLVDGRVAD